MNEYSISYLDFFTHCHGVCFFDQPSHDFLPGQAGKGRRQGHRCRIQFRWFQKLLQVLRIETLEVTVGGKKNCFRLRFYPKNGATVTCFLFFLSWLVLQFYQVLPPFFFLPGYCFSPKGANYSQLAKARGFCSPFCFSQRLGVEDFTSRPAATHPAEMVGMLPTHKGHVQRT